jgi:hypothetical protein
MITFRGDLEGESIRTHTPSREDSVNTVLGTTHDEMVQRITDTFRRATPSDIEAGTRWYADGETVIDELAVRANVTREHVAAVMAHLSPQTRWARTMAGTYSLILTGIISPGHLTKNTERAIDAMKSNDPLGTLNGPKTRRFAANLLGDREAVTVDVWALRVALGPSSTLDLKRTNLARGGRYAAVEAAYRAAAREIGVDPATAQAVTWVVARNGRAA